MLGVHMEDGPTAASCGISSFIDRIGTTWQRFSPIQVLDLRLSCSGPWVAAQSWKHLIPRKVRSCL